MPDIVTSKTFVDGEKGITATKLNQIISGAVIQPSFVTAKPSSSTLDPTDQLLEVKGAGTYATITGQQLIDSVSASVTQNISPTIWSVRLRSFNAIGNPTFEVDQRNCGALSANVNGMAQDRWAVVKTGTLVASAQQMAGLVTLPGTNFAITNNFLRLTITTAQASLGASDNLQMFQQIEAPALRELISDVTSFSLLVRSSVAGLKFGIALQSPTGTTYSLVKLATIPNAATWTLIPFANLPIWSASATWPLTAGNIGYVLRIVLAAGITVTTSANDVWVATNAYGAIGQSSLAATSGASFDVAFISHEPGAQCSNPPLDCPFTQNYDSCLRYFQKSYEYGTAIATVATSGLASFMAPVGGSTSAYGALRLPKPMAKTPTFTLYNHATGAANSVRDGAATDHASASASISSQGSIGQIAFATGTAAATQVQFQYTADTGW